MDSSYPLFCACERFGDRVALVPREGAPVTFRELERRIALLAGGWSATGRAGRTTGLLLDNRPETVELQMALARAGSVVVPLNTRLTPDELRFIADDAGLEAVVAVDALRAAASAIAGDGRRELLGLDDLAELRGRGEALQARVDGDEDAPATITYTSGTTGRPKGVVRAHRANSWNPVNSALGSPRDVDDVEVFNLPAFGIGFLHFLVPALLGGATVVLDEAFAPARAWELLERHRATRTFLAPTMISSMLEVDGHERFDLSALRIVYTAYAFPERLRARALERFGERFVYMYGLTEAQLTCARAEDFVADPADVGTTMGVCRVGVFGPDGARRPDGEVGEIAFQGPATMSGYHNLPQATGQALRDGWVLTGDLGRMGPDGHLRYVGREKEMIKTGGFSVDPVEVEEAILALDEVAEAAVVGWPDEHWGEAVVAFVRPAGDGPLDTARIVASCRERIATYKVPKRVIVLADLPKNPTGKVERGRLRALAAAQTATEE